MKEYIGQIKKNGPLTCFWSRKMDPWHVFGQENGLLTRFWPKSLIKIFGSELFDMGWPSYWKRQYFLVRPNTAIKDEYGFWFSPKLLYSGIKPHALWGLNLMKTPHVVFLICIPEVLLSNIYDSWSMKPMEHPIEMSNGETFFDLVTLTMLT